MVGNFKEIIGPKLISTVILFSLELAYIASIIFVLSINENDCNYSVRL